MTERTHTGDAADRAFATGRDGGLNATCLVEAGAGTGKTSVLIDRLLALVLSGTSVSRIVAITFTEKAAGELRVRLRSGLEGAARRGAGEERERLDAAVREVDRAQVGTIHSFCSGLLRERPVEAGVDPNFAVADELRQARLLDSAWESWIRTELSGIPPRSVADARALGVGLGKIRDLALTLIESRDVVHLAPAAVDPGDVDALVRDLQDESRAFADLAKTRANDPEDKAVADILEFERAVEALELLPEESRATFALSQIAPAPSRRRGRKGGWDDGLLEELRGRAERLRERQADLRARAGHNAMVGLIEWLGGCTQAYENEKSRSAVLDFQDLLSKARDLLRDDLGVREHFKRSYDRILVDEFQDTDPLQCEIVFFLAEREGGRARDWRQVELEPGKLFIVGDPKQSIYRFRRADIETYESAREMISEAGSVLRLSENFRTRPAILECVNAVFGAAMAPPDDGRRYQPPYEALAPHRPADSEGPGTVVVLPGPGARAFSSVAECREAEAAAVAAFISGMLEAGAPRVFDRVSASWRRPRLGDVAVLFHSRTALDAYEAALNARGLDYRMAGGKRFYARREVSELATVLAAIEDPHDLVAVVGALRTPFMGVPDDDIVVHRQRTGGLNYLVAQGGGVRAVEDAFDVLRELHGRRNAGTIADLMARLFERTAALELFLLKPTGEQRHANLLKVVELASSLEKEEPMSFGGFVRWLREVSQLAPEEAESPLSEEGDDFIRMLTIHKAKGLEFPVAILADLGRVRRGVGNVIVDREEGRVEVGLGAAHDGLATLGYETSKALEERRAEAERLRLLYVGMTRARDLLVVPWFTKDGAGDVGFLEYLRGQGEEPSGALPGVRPVDAGTLDLDVRAGRPLRLRAADVPAGSATGRAALEEWRQALRSFGRRHDRPGLRITPSSLAHASGEEPDREPWESSAPRMGGARLGTLVHAAMERIDFAAPGDADAVVEALARTSGLSGDETSEAVRLIESSLRSDVMRRAALSRNALREVPFCVRDGEAFIEGKIDLLFEEDDGLVVVDYKTDATPAGGWDLLAERYRDQAAAYGLAAGVATGLPVKEVVLLFMRGPQERRVVVGASGAERKKALGALIAGARAGNT